MNTYQEANIATKDDTYWHEMELRMNERLLTVKNMRMTDALLEPSSPNIQLPSTRIS